MMEKDHQVKEDMEAVVAEDKVVHVSQIGSMINLAHNAIIAKKLVIMPMNATPKKDEKINYANDEEKQDDRVLLMAYNGMNTRNSSVWYLDTSVSNHVCGRNEFFVELDEDCSGTIIFCDLSQKSVKGKGKIILQLKTSDHRCISNVYYILDKKNNILNMG